MTVSRTIGRPVPFADLLGVEVEHTEPGLARLALAVRPELAGEIFGKPEVGVLPRLVHSRFGLHVVEVLARQPGLDPAFEAVKSAVAQGLRQQAFATALRQYLQLLAGEATLIGVDLEAAASPLVQ